MIAAICRQGELAASGVHAGWAWPHASIARGVAPRCAPPHERGAGLNDRVAPKPRFPPTIRLAGAAAALAIIAGTVAFAGRASEEAVQIAQAAIAPAAHAHAHAQV